MYCTQCGKEVPGEAAYCASCGSVQPRLMARRRLVRPLAGRKIAGVCLGVANYLELDVTLVRVIWVILALIPIPVVSGVLTYIVAWILMPNEEPAPHAATSAAPASAPHTERTA